MEKYLRSLTPDQPLLSAIISDCCTSQTLQRKTFFCLFLYVQLGKNILAVTVFVE